MLRTETNILHLLVPRLFLELALQNWDSALMHHFSSNIPKAKWQGSKCVHMLHKWSVRRLIFFKAQALFWPGPNLHFPLENIISLMTWNRPGVWQQETQALPTMQGGQSRTDQAYILHQNIGCLNEQQEGRRRDKAFVVFTSLVFTTSPFCSLTLPDQRITLSAHPLCRFTFSNRASSWEEGAGGAPLLLKSD